MSENGYAIAEYVTADDIKRVRSKLKMNQVSFAKLIGVSKPTIERYEANKEKIRGPITLLLQMLEKNPDYVNEIKVRERTYPLRMWYMMDQMICTLIDVDDVNKKVKIRNYVDNAMFKAFGNNENPTYEDYLQFLENRCFPRTRDKMKLVLKDLDLPFYDPYLIVKKTKGRMADDCFWLKIEG